MRRITTAALFCVLFFFGRGDVHADEAVGWEHREYQGLTWEAAVTPVAGMVMGDGELHLGFAATASLRYVMWASSGTSLQGIVRDSVVGDHFGIDLNTYGLRHQDRWLWMLAVDPALRNIVGERTSSSRLQISSLADVLLPEVGYAFRSADNAWFLGWHLRADYLVSKRVAVSGRLGLQILYDDDPDGIVTAGIGLTVR